VAVASAVRGQDASSVAQAESAAGASGAPALPARSVVGPAGRPVSGVFGNGSGASVDAEGAKQVQTGVVLGVRPAAEVPVRRCEFSFQVSGWYDKPDFTAVMREEGIATGVSTCGPDLVPAMTVDATIHDFGMPGVGGHQIATGTNQGSGPGPVVATVSQSVMLVESPPPDNYRIEWTFRLHAASVDGQQATACAKLQAVFPGSVTSTSCWPEWRMGARRPPFAGS